MDFSNSKQFGLFYSIRQNLTAAKTEDTQSRPWIVDLLGELDSDIIHCDGKEITSISLENDMNQLFHDDDRRLCLKR